MKTTKLHKNDLASLQSLSGGMAGDDRFHHKFKIGKERIENIGLKTSVSKHALHGIEYISNNPDKRAEDLMEAFCDKDIKIIIANIGGFDSHKLIPFLDVDKITANPKPILGYSDITSLHLFLYTLGIQTYYGPAVLDGFAENVEMHEITKESAKNVLFTNNEQILKQSNNWTSEFLDWANEEFNNTKRKMNDEEHGSIWLNFNNEIKGHLIGGCLDTIVQVKDEAFFPEINHWKDSVIFLETSEQKMSPEKFKEAIKILKNEISICSAIIFGKPKDETFFNEYLDILKEDIDKPIIFNLNFGHTAPLYTIPYGGKAKLDFANKTISITK